MDMLGGSGIESQCRKVDIIADAAYAIFKKPKSFTGNFVIDENILKEEGIKNFDAYAIKPEEEERKDPNALMLRRNIHPCVCFLSSKVFFSCANSSCLRLNNPE
ncbi:hypothetical protein P7K49_001543 [Saguinus oedipus]|uniref:Uncharacterized protein n=1 Tax=Saguinus oedipus TaxID=9490 RepID=A0ABQ9WIN8_SAGOE|nr:hypothetical protein P7K49_001543 [Saguinus oedipus]